MQRNDQIHKNKRRKTVCITQNRKLKTDQQEPLTHGVP